jgi:hypothetical protein
MPFSNLLSIKMQKKLDVFYFPKLAESRKSKLKLNFLRKTIPTMLVKDFFKQNFQ